MNEHFPDGYEVVREKEYVVGQTTHYDDERIGGQVAVIGVAVIGVAVIGVAVIGVAVIGDVLSVGTSRGRGSATTSPQTEYRFHYRRRDPRRPGF
jgi:hypothetical protein